MNNITNAVLDKITEHTYTPNEETHQRLRSLVVFALYAEGVEDDNDSFVYHSLLTFMAEEAERCHEGVVFSNLPIVTPRVKACAGEVLGIVLWALQIENMKYQK